MSADGQAPRVSVLAEAAPRFGRVAIVGVGLIGGSVAAALRKRGLAVRIVGHSPADQHKAMALDLLDEAAPSLEAAMEGADVVVLAAPVSAIVETMPRLAGCLPPGAVLTDTGSTKRSIVEAAVDGLGARLSRFVPAHPIAGSERSGPGAANADLFDGARVILSPLPFTDEDALARVDAFWRSLGARTVSMPPDAHDRLLAAVSHLPHVVAFALARALAGRDDARDALRLAGGGLRDTSRIAASSPSLWADILVDNGDAVLTALRDYERAWKTFADAVEAGDRTRLAALIAEASDWRRRM